MTARKNIRLILEYDGRRYHGWQRQKNARTIQGVLEEGIQRMTGEPATLFASGRTDAGVHALHQVCHFLTRSAIPPQSFRSGLNSLVRPDIFIKEATYVPPDFHARYGARSKTYEYRILNRREPDVFLRHTTWHVPMRLDMEEMRKCLDMVLGRHDFSSFRSSGSGNIDPVREITRAELHTPQDGLLHVVFEANGFLRHMVRNIVGTLVDAGLGKIDSKDFERILASGDRRQAGIKAPAQGLFLTMVRYDGP